MQNLSINYNIWYSWVIPHNTKSKEYQNPGGGQCFVSGPPPRYTFDQDLGLQYTLQYTRDIYYTFRSFIHHPNNFFTFPLFPSFSFFPTPSVLIFFSSSHPPPHHSIFQNIYPCSKHGFPQVYSVFSKITNLWFLY